MYNTILKLVRVTAKKNLFYFICFMGLSCNKLIDVGPPKTDLTGNTVFTNDATATAALTGIYEKMSAGADNFGNGAITLYGGLAADELVNYSTYSGQAEFYAANITTRNEVISNLWAQAYAYIYQANAVLEGLIDSTLVTRSLRQQLRGEAKFIRSFCYLYLVNLFGDVPLVLTTNYSTNAELVRTSKAEVYQQIISDLNDARNIMMSDYIFSNEEKVRPTRWAAEALLARVYLYLEEWQNAEAISTDIINNGPFTLVNELDNVFLKNSDEAIWQLSPVRPSINTEEGNLFILTGLPNTAALSGELVNSFELGDQRKVHWIGMYSAGSQSFYYPYKYKVKLSPTISEYYMVLRLGEQFLIRAESRIHQGNISGCQNDLNLIRNRAGLPNTIETEETGLLNAVYHERQVELFVEWGHRWFDLKRTGKADSVLSVLKTDWQGTDELFPIPQSEIANDPRLSQNPGY